MPEVLKGDAMFSSPNMQSNVETHSFLLESFSPYYWLWRSKLLRTAEYQRRNSATNKKLGKVFILNQACDEYLRCLVWWLKLYTEDLGHVCWTVYPYVTGDQGLRFVFPGSLLLIQRTEIRAQRYLLSSTESLKWHKRTVREGQWTAEWRYSWAPGYLGLPLGEFKERASDY